MATTMTPTDDRPITLEIERAGRRYPELPGLQKKATRGRIRELETQASDESLPQALAKTLLERLAWHKIQSAERPTRDEVVAAYIDSLKQLDSFRNDVQHMIRAACQANLEFRQGGERIHAEARDNIVNAKLEEMVSQASSQWLPVKNIAGAALLSQSPAVYRQKLDTSLSEAVTDFARQFFDLLARLVDRELCGLVEWLPNHCCRYHFFRRVVIQGDEVRTERVNVSRFENPRNGNGGSLEQVVGRRRTKKTRKVSHQIRYARHEHDVINAIRTSIGNSTVVKPPHVDRLIDSIPDWLYPFVEVIDGHIVRERIIERDVKVADWTQVQVHDEPIMGYEPGIIVGPYVLTGWGPREIAIEQERRKSAEQVVNQVVEKQLAPVFVVAATGLGLIALVLLYRSLQGHGGFLFAMLATVAAIGSVWQAVFGIEVGRRNPTAAQYAHFVTAAVAFPLFLAEWFLARTFFSLSWLTPVILIGGALISYLLGRQFKSNS